MTVRNEMYRIIKLCNEAYLEHVEGLFKDRRVRH